MEIRLSKLKKEIKDKNLDAVLIYKPENRRYISGFTGSSGYALITEEKNLFITDFRYVEQSKKQCLGFEIVEHSKNHTLYDLLNDLNINNLGFEDDFVTYKEYASFKEKLHKSMLIPLNGLMQTLRKIKDSEEIENIAKAANIADEAFEHICEYIKPGVEERDIAIELKNYMERKGASGTSFETIVASGIRSSLPHGVATNKIVEEGDFITMDFGCVYNGYCSDMTRTVVLGKATPKQKEIYHIVLEAQLKALDAIKPGVAGKDVDQVARDIINAKGYGRNFGHGLGHGVGLEIHEDPRLSPVGEEILKAGMVVTDEPGIYIPDFGGVRIEDLVVVTENGNMILSKSPKQLIEL